MAAKLAWEGVSFGSQNLAEDSKLGESGRQRGLQTAAKKTLKGSQDPQPPILQFRGKGMGLHSRNRGGHVELANWLLDGPQGKLRCTEPHLLPLLADRTSCFARGSGSSPSVKSISLAL